MINLKWLSKIQGTRGIFANSKRSYGKITIQILHFLQRAFEIQAIQTKSEATMNAGKKGKKKEVMFWRFINLQGRAVRLVQGTDLAWKEWELGHISEVKAHPHPIWVLYTLQHKPTTKYFSDPQKSKGWYFYHFSSEDHHTSFWRDFKKSQNSVKEFQLHHNSTNSRNGTESIQKLDLSCNHT